MQLRGGQTAPNARTQEHRERADGLRAPATTPHSASDPAETDPGIASFLNLRQVFRRYEEMRQLCDSLLRNPFLRAQSQAGLDRDFAAELREWQHRQNAARLQEWLDRGYAARLQEDEEEEKEASAVGEAGESSQQPSQESGSGVRNNTGDALNDGAVDNDAVDDVTAVDEEGSEGQTPPKQCSICLDPVGTSGNGDAEALGCLHVFCREDIRGWLEDHNTCPECRYEPTWEERHDLGLN